MEYLPEHQAPEKVEPAQTTEDDKTVRLVEGLFRKAKKSRERYDHNWLNNYKMFRGQQWREPRPSYRHQEVFNLIFQSIQSTVPIQTDARPRIEFIPVEASDYEFAEILNKVCESDWEKNNWAVELLETIYDANFYGTGFGYVGFDPKAELGIGGICFESHDPFYSFPDPVMRNLNDKYGRYFIHAEPKTKEELVKEYGEKAKDAAADLADLIKGDKTELGAERFKRNYPDAVYYDAGERLEDEEKCLKIICWLKSDETIEELASEKDHEGKDVYETKLKYPNGRKIVIAGGKLLEDGPNPFEDGRFPYARLLNYSLPREFWGMSEIEQLEGPQKVFNKLVNYALDVLTLMGNPVWLVNNASNVDQENLTNRPGLVIGYDNQPPARVEGVQLQPFVLQMIDRMEKYFNSIAGSQDVSRGARPEGITAAAAINELQEAAQTRLRLKGRLLDAYLKDIGKLYMARVFQFYSTPRVFRITNNQNAQSYFKMSVGTNEVGQRVANITPIKQEVDQAGAVVQVQGDVRQLIINGDFDVRVDTGSGLPFAQNQKLNLAMQMFKAGVIDGQALLEAADYPGKEQIMARMQQQAAQAAQMQMLQGAPPA